ncbi:hypothetical protein [Tomitella biformata]|uniref:hypothetical protein n=1 Tax=Tomitella biformata TaxID=630403 RepID=UPI0004AEA650|nr:hypothetical protein [Tomitella biformata]
MAMREAGQKLHVVVGAPWKDALLGYLSADAPGDNWDLPDGLRKGDLLLSILETTPRTVLCLERVARGGRSLELEEVWDWPGLPELATLESASGLRIRKSAGQVADAAADRVLAALDTLRGDRDSKEDGSTATAARVISGSGLRCGGCEDEFALSGGDARNQVRVFALESNGETVRRGLCASCQRAARKPEVTTMAQLKHAVFPACPLCGAQATSSIAWGMPAEPPPPWVVVGGCCIAGNDPDWSCGACGHCWGPRELPPKTGDRAQAHLFNFDGRAQFVSIPDVRDPQELQVGELIVEGVGSAWGEYSRCLIIRDDGALRLIEPDTIVVIERG